MNLCSLFIMLIALVALVMSGCTLESDPSSPSGEDGSNYLGFGTASDPDESSTPLCSNGFVDSGEECDDPGNQSSYCGQAGTPQACQCIGSSAPDPNSNGCVDSSTLPACAPDGAYDPLEGDCDPQLSTTCNTDCSCPTGFSPDGAGDCTQDPPMATCGDGVREGAEQCENPNMSSNNCNPANCMCLAGYQPASPTSTTCVQVSNCGNGMLDAGEACELTGSGCASNCQCEAGLVADGTGNMGCTSPAPTCGDDVVDPGEECDDSADNNCDINCACVGGFDADPSGNGCVPHVVSCGDGIIEAGEQCETGWSGCTTDTCQCLPQVPVPNASIMECEAAPPLCGNGTIEMGEQCESGDDFCSGTCQCNAAVGAIYDPADPNGPCVIPDSCDGTWDAADANAGNPCDGGPNCGGGTCTCASGYYPDGQGGCVIVSVCGDGLLQSDSSPVESCDGGIDCNQSCRCPVGFFPDGTVGCMVPGGVEIPGNGIDDDGDGDVDCADSGVAAGDLAWQFIVAIDGTVMITLPDGSSGTFSDQYITLDFDCADVDGGISAELVLDPNSMLQVSVAAPAHNLTLENLDDGTFPASSVSYGLITNSDFTTPINLSLTAN